MDWMVNGKAAQAAIVRMRRIQQELGLWNPCLMLKVVSSWLFRDIRQSHWRERSSMRSLRTQKTAGDRMRQIARLDSECISIPLAEREIRIWRPVNAESYILNTTQADFGEEERLPYWAMLWPACIALAEELACATDMAGRSLIELGAGLGVPAIAAATSGASVMATDWYNEALEFIRESADANAVTVHAKFLDWRFPPALPKFDVLAGADLLYERRNHALILDLMERFVAPDGFAIFSDPQRHMSADFFDAADSMGWQSAKSTRSVTWEGANFEVDLWRLARSVPS